MCAPFFRFVLTRGWSTRTLTYRKSLITTGSSVSRLMEPFCLRQRLWINVFVLTTAYWICQVRTLKERNINFRLAFLAYVNVYCMLLLLLLHIAFSGENHMHMAHRAVNAQIESMSSFNLRDKQSGRHGLRPFATASFSRVRLFWGNSEPSATKDV